MPEVIFDRLLALTLRPGMATQIATTSRRVQFVLLNTVSGPKYTVRLPR
jgi:hypothetical protein